LSFGGEIFLRLRAMMEADGMPAASCGRRLAFVVTFALAFALAGSGCAHRYEGRGVVLRVEREADDRATLRAAEVAAQRLGPGNAATAKPEPPGPAEPTSTSERRASDGRTASITISHDAIPGYMDAMVMPFTVRPPASATPVAAGDRVAFRLRVGKGRSWIDRLQLLSAPRTDAGLLESPARPRLVPVGGAVPDFELTDHRGARVSLASLRGQVLVITFIYTRCPLPDYCPLMLTNLKSLATRFAPRLGRDVSLLVVTFDPKFDTPDVLRAYARLHAADTPGWHFLTGPPADITRVCEAFGLEFWPEEGLLTHSLQTAVLDRTGLLAGTIEGKSYSPRQLADLVDSALAR
jgi:protein SCO1/2